MTDGNIAQDEGIALQKKQQASALLRQGFLQSIQVLSGAKCTIVTYEKTKLEAEFLGCHNTGQEMLVRNLQTPSGEVMSSARLRAPDILYIEFDKSIQNEQILKVSDTKE